MKMPQRPFYPSIHQAPDIFGLHSPSLLGRAFESKADTQNRVAKVEKGVEDAFKAAVKHLGEEEARQLFRRVIRKRKRGLGKTLAPDRDARLLQEYDASIQIGESTAALARRLRPEGRELGDTADAIQTQIRKLVKERKKRQRDAAFETRRWRMATRNEPPSFLSAAKSEK
jgi:hypothetical protein